MKLLIKNDIIHFGGTMENQKLCYESGIEEKSYDSSYDYTVYDIAFLFQDDEEEEVETDDGSEFEEIIEA